VFALFLDPGRIDTPGRFRIATRPLRSFRRWAHCEKLDLGARWHGLHTRCLRFIGPVTRSDARLTSGCGPGSTRWDWLPTGFRGKVSDLRLLHFIPLSQALPDARTTQLSSGRRRSERRLPGTEKAAAVCWSGKEVASPPPPPLRTARAGFLACRSSIGQRIPKDTRLPPWLGGQPGRYYGRADSRDDIGGGCSTGKGRCDPADISATQPTPVG
jgi:hypothetical protein